MKKYKIIEDRGARIYYDLATNLNFEEAQKIKEMMDIKAQTDPGLSNGDNEPYSYWIIPEE